MSVWIRRLLACLLGIASPSRVGMIMYGCDKPPRTWLDRWERRIDMRVVRAFAEDPLLWVADCVLRRFFVGAALEALERLGRQRVTRWRGQQLASVDRFLDASEYENTLTRATGSWIADGFEVGDTITIAARRESIISDVGQ